MKVNSGWADAFYFGGLAIALWFPLLALCLFTIFLVLRYQYLKLSNQVILTGVLIAYILWMQSNPVMLPLLVFISRFAVDDFMLKKWSIPIVSIAVVLKIILLQQFTVSEIVVVYVAILLQLWQYKSRSYCVGFANLLVTICLSIVAPESIHILLLIAIICVAVTKIHPRLRTHLMRFLPTLCYLTLSGFSSFPDQFVGVMLILFVISILPFVSRKRKSNYAYILALLMQISASVMYLIYLNQTNISHVVLPMVIANSVIWSLQRSTFAPHHRFHIGDVLVILSTLPIMLFTLLRLPNHQRNLPIIYGVYLICMGIIFLLNQSLFTVLIMIVIGHVLCINAFARSIRVGTSYTILWIAVISVILSLTHQNHYALHQLIVPFVVFVTFTVWRTSDGAIIIVSSTVISLLHGTMTMDLPTIFFIAYLFDKYPLPQTRLLR